MEVLKTLFFRIPIVLFIIGVLLSIFDSYTLNQYRNIILISTAVFIFVLLHTNWIQKEDPLDKMIYQLEELKKRHTISPETQAKIKKVKLFNISNINEKHEVLGMIESSDTNKDKARRNIQAKACILGANAVINITTHIDNNVSGYVSTESIRSKMVSGETTTVTTYHYEGTAIRII